MMKPYQANYLTAFVLIAMSLWGYIVSSSMTALIPAIFGLLFLLAGIPFKRENKLVAHIVVVLTLLIIIALIKPLTGAINDGRTDALIRVGIMLLTSIFAFGIYIKSFVDARKAKKA